MVNIFGRAPTRSFSKRNSVPLEFLRVFVISSFVINFEWISCTARSRCLHHHVNFTVNLNYDFSCLLPLILSLAQQVFPHANAKSLKLSRIIAATGLDAKHEYISTTWRKVFLLAKRLHVVIFPFESFLRIDLVRYRSWIYFHGKEIEIFEKYL